MELFRINCVTCQAELSVRNEAIIGTIIGCPKCGSMVEVVAPVAEPEAEEPLTDVDSPVLTPEASAGSSFLTWALCTTAAGLTLIAGLTWWLSSAEVAEPIVASQPAPAKATDEETPTIDQEPALDSGAEETIAKEPSEKSDPLIDREMEPVAELARATEPSPVEAKTLEDSPKQPIEEITEAAEKVAEVPNPPRHVFNALDLDPESMALDSLDQEPKAPVQPKIEVPAHPQHSNVLESDISTLPVVRRSAVPAEGMSTRNAQQQFELVLPALAVRELPLASFLQMIGKISGVPVTVTAEQFQMAGISPRKPISLEVSNTSLDTVLKQVLEPLQLEHRFDGPHVIVTRASADKLREIEYPLDDLVSSAAEREQLRQWIEQLVMPESWESGRIEIDGDALKVEQTQRVHYQLLAFLERLRMVRGLETRSRFPVARLVPTPLHAAMAPRLSRSALFTFTQDTPFSEVLQHWQRELEVPMLVDWTALSELDLWPDTPISCAIADRNWQQALTAVLEPLGLSWRVCSGGGIEITTLEQSRTNLQLELYPLTETQQHNGEALLEQLREYLSRLPSGLENTDSIVIVYDSKGPSLFALLRAEAQRDTLQWLNDSKLFRAQ